MLLMLPTENSFTALCNSLQIDFSNMDFLETPSWFSLWIPRPIKIHFCMLFQVIFFLHCFFFSFCFSWNCFFFSVHNKSNLKLCLVTAWDKNAVILINVLQLANCFLLMFFQYFQMAFYVCLQPTLAAIQCLKIRMHWPDQFQLNWLMTGTKLTSPLKNSFPTIFEFHRSIMG